MSEDRDDTDLDDVVRMAHRFYRRSKTHSSEWREMARKWYDLVANKQWDDTDIKVLEEQRRIPVVINRVARAVNAILGTQVSNRQETRFIPREEGDVKVNELITGAGDWVRDGCDAEDEESDAFEDTTTCGMGWTNTRMDYERDLEGMGIIERVDPLKMHWDPAAHKRNIADAKWVMLMEDYDPEDFKARWPDADHDLSAGTWDDVTEDDTGNQRTHVYPQDAYKNQQSGATEKGKTIKVAQLQYETRVPVYRVGKLAERLSEEQFKKIKDKIEEAGLPYVKQYALAWRQAFVAGGALLEDEECPYPEGPTFRCITYKRDRNKNTWYGIVAAMMDPQKYGNKFLSLIMDILVKNSKGGVMAEKDAVDDPKELEDKWAQPDAVAWFRSGALASGKVMPKPITNLPAGLDRLVAYFLDSVHEVTGINLELLGMANREQAGVLEHQRKQAGVTIIAPLFDGLRRYRKEQGRVLLHFIQAYLSDGRLIRINGQGSEQYVKLMKQDGVAKYDVIVDEAPTSPNMKEKVFGAIAELMPVLAKMGIPIPPELLDYTPLPSSLIAKWKELIESAKGMDPKQMQEQMQKLQQEMQKLAQENQQLKDKRAQEEMKMEMDRQKAQQDFELEQERLALERWKAEAEMELQREKTQNELTLQRERAETELVLQHDKSNQEMQINQEKAARDHELKATSEAMGAKNLEIELPSGQVIRLARGEGGVDARIEDKRKRQRKVKIKRDPQTDEIIGADVDGDEILIERAS